MASKYFIKLRFATLRLLCLAYLSSIVLYAEAISLKPSPSWVIFRLTISSIAFVYHLASAFGPTYSLPRVLDLVLTLTELASTVYREILVLY
ncbi:hypothetical protein CPB83DRAFT_447846 [Crepidotus variabilis]|uniref:Uncharacterized protein n=1 Tax=Crepidotus variabilis TaxID=179855 RepID=A0A9P6EDI0_9AGAR|nr:hypothetical protein CPB83DRAFT_447846 [Crepidotus variabilis]